MNLNSPVTAETPGLGRRRPPHAGFLAAMLVMGAASVALRGDATPDVSWLITMCERVLNGEQAYVDIVETTPPVPLLLYMPGALLAKYVGGAAEAWTFAFAYASVFGSLWLAARILPTYVTEGGRSDWLLLAPAAVVFFLLPSDAFAQREYFAAAWALPMTAVFIRHAYDRSWPPLTDRFVAAFLGGLTIAIKPPLFAVPGILLALYYWARTRNLGFLLPSGLFAAAAIGLAVTAASAYAFPDYLRNTSGIMRDLYVPARLPAFVFFLVPSCLGAFSCLGITLLLSLQGGVPAATISAFVGAGFLAACVVQGKYFGYHAYPAAPFSVAAASVVVFAWFRGHTHASLQMRATAVGVYGLAAGGAAALLIVGFAGNRPIMRDLTWSRTLAHPRALAVSPIEDTSFPLARQIGAVWVGRSHSQWIARYVNCVLDGSALTTEKKKQLLDYRRSDLESVLREIKDKRPELIIEDSRPGYAWLVPELNALQPGFLDGYRVIAEEGGIRVRRATSGPISPRPLPETEKKAGQ